MSPGSTRVNSAPMSPIIVCFAKLCLISSAWAIGKCKNISRKGAKEDGLSLRLCASAGDYQRSRVALKTGEFGAFHRTSAETSGVRLRREFEYLIEICVDVSFARSESRFTRRLLETIPRTNILTDVATIQPTRKFALDLVR